MFLFRKSESFKFLPLLLQLIPFFLFCSFSFSPFLSSLRNAFRYDVRATISDITPYETSSTVGINRFDGLSESEKQAEMLAEEERYYSLYRNEVEEELYKGTFK